MKKTISLFLVLILGLSLLAGCGGGGGGGGDALKGTWAGTYEDGDATWTFDGSGKCTLTNYFVEKEPGKYTIKSDSEVEIKLDPWDSPIIYTFKVGGDNLTLTSPDPYSPNYELNNK